jgi:CRP-like cAMP-binding protein
VDALREISSPITNRLLAALPRDEYDRLFPALESVKLPKNSILYEAGDTIQYAYLLNTGMVSFLAITEDGQTIDIGMVGSEGFIGDDVVLRAATTPGRAMTQFPCEAVRIEPKPTSLNSVAEGSCKSCFCVTPPF